MKSTPVAVTAALSSMLVLSACSGVDEPSSSTEGTDNAASTDPSSGDEATASPDDSVVSAAPEGEGAVSIEEADAIAETVLTLQAESTQGDGDDIEKAINSSTLGLAKDAAIASDKLEPVLGAPDELDLDENPVEPNVLAISRDDGQSPALILVQTVPDNELPELHLLSKPKDADDFRIVWSAPMMPDTNVATFDRRSVGTPVLREGGGDFIMTPGTALNTLADNIDFPADEQADFRDHGYDEQVRNNAQRQADAVAEQANLSETHRVLPGEVYTLILEDGSAMTFAAIERMTRFDIKSGMTLIAPDTFSTFASADRLSNDATLETLVFVAVEVPAEGDSPELIAAREQIVGATGS